MLMIMRLYRHEKLRNMRDTTQEDPRELLAQGMGIKLYCLGW